MLVVQCSSQRDWQNSLIPSSARRLYACPSFQSKLGCLDLDSVKFLWRCCRIAGCVLGSGEHSDMCGGRVGRPSVNLYRLRVLGKMEQFTQSSNIEKFIENIVIKFLAGGGASPSLLGRGGGGLQSPRPLPPHVPNATAIIIHHYGHRHHHCLQGKTKASPISIRAPSRYGAIAHSP